MGQDISFPSYTSSGNRTLTLFKGTFLKDVLFGIANVRSNLLQMDVNIHAHVIIRTSCANTSEVNKLYHGGYVCVKRVAFA